MILNNKYTLTCLIIRNKKLINESKALIKQNKRIIRN